MVLIRRIGFAGLFAFASVSASEAKQGPVVEVVVRPEVTRSIEGISELDRQVYFALCDHGVGFPERIGNEERYRYLVDELGVCFGRSLGPVRGWVRRRNFVKEDASRPGFADLEGLKKQLEKSRKGEGEAFVEDFGPNLDVAAHGAHGAYPEFMGRALTETLRRENGEQAHRHAIPANAEAAAELAATVFRFGYSGFTRPRYFEPINEPHWSYLTQSDELAQWHLVTRKRMKAMNPEVLVGGPCNSVGYFYSRNYQAFNGVRKFIEETRGELDFYSFHVYDYYSWDGNKFGASRLSGLPLEGVLDLVANEQLLRNGCIKPVVVSEFGGYLSGMGTDNSREQVLKIARERIPGEGFEWELKARSIHDFLQIRSTVASALVFMDHPHLVVKAVPFLLPDTSAWDPKYYASLYVRKNFEKGNPEWVETSLLDYYRLFRDVKGRRVVAESGEPDLQVRSFVEGKKMFIILNNLSGRERTLRLGIPEFEDLTLRRYSRNEDLTSSYREVGSDDRTLTMAGDEIIVAIARFAEPVREQARIRENVHYADQVTAKSGTSFQISTEGEQGLVSAKLRIGFNRPVGLPLSMKVRFNGEVLEDRIEESSSSLSHEKHGYSTMRNLEVPVDFLREENEVTVSFPDGGEATIGAVVLRTRTAS